MTNCIENSIFVRSDYLSDIVKPMVKQRKRLGMTQDEVNAKLGVADRLVSKWECGARTPTSFNLYCWAEVLEGQLVFLPILKIDSANAVNDNNPRIHYCEGQARTADYRKTRAYY